MDFKKFAPSPVFLWQLSIEHKGTNNSLVASKKQAIGRGRPRKLVLRDSIYLLNLACHKPTMFLDEYAKCLKDGHYIDASLTTIHITLARAGLNIKRVQKLAAERSPTIRADFICHIAQYCPISNRISDVP